MISSEHRTRRRRPSAARRNRCATSKKGGADDVSRRALPRHRTGRGPQRRASARLWASPAPPPPFGHPVLHVGAPHLPRPRAPLRAGRRFDARDARLVGPQRERRAAPFRRRSAHAASWVCWRCCAIAVVIRARRHARSHAFAFGLRRTRRTPPSPPAQQAVNLSTPQSAWRKGAAPQPLPDRPPVGGTPLRRLHPGSLGRRAHLPGHGARRPERGRDGGAAWRRPSYAQNSGFAQQEDATALLTDGRGGAWACAAAAVEARRDGRCAARSTAAGPSSAPPRPAPSTRPPPTSCSCSIDEYSQLIIRDPLSSERTEQHWTFEDILGTSVGLWSYTLAQ